jgi:hypothetical protein
MPLEILCWGIIRRMGDDLHRHVGGAETPLLIVTGVTVIRN